MSNRIEIVVGDRFGRLVVDGPPYILSRPGKQDVKKVPCLCDCGQRKIILAGSLRSGNTTSCGCARAIFNRECRTTHGLSKTPLYGVWLSMRRRCSDPKNPAYGRYGGRGIFVCQEWAEGFPVFQDWAERSGYRKGLWIERKNNDGPYSPDNCCWATPKEQNRNRTSSLWATAWGESKRIADWADDPRCVVGRLLIRNRLMEGWIAEDAITSPLRRGPMSVRETRALMAAVTSEIEPWEIEWESWMDVPDWPAYQASDLGRVRSIANSIRNGKTIADIPEYERKYKLRSVAPSDGCRYITLHSNNKQKRFSVARLVLMAHVGMPPDGMDACHSPDPNPLNCRLSNLRWDTRQENIRDKARHRKFFLEVARSEDS